MTVSELAQLEWQAQIDDLMARLQHWAEHRSDWEPIRQAQAFLKRLLQRLDRLRGRLEAPLVVGTFGGTGVGKSSLVNALVGEEVVQVGRQRPTTTQPTLLVHPEIDLKSLDLPLEELQIVRCETPWMRDWLLIDCPDPDTSEAATPTSNLARLQRILPCCDVLLYVSTQQKYRSAQVSKELAQAAESAKVVFVQSHADKDDDIRADWRRQLEPRYHVADMFYLDSRQALHDLKAGLTPNGEYLRLRELLQRELASGQRVRIRRENLFGLVQAGLQRLRHELEQAARPVHELEDVLEKHHHELVEALTQRCFQELLDNRAAWESRVLRRVVQRWQLSPFSLVLRIYARKAELLTRWGLLRARSMPQLALSGALATGAWLKQYRHEKSRKHLLEHLAQTTGELPQLPQLQTIWQGYLRQARLDRQVAERILTRLQPGLAQSSSEFLTHLDQRLEQVTAEVARRHTTWPVRTAYELGYALLPAWLVYRVGKNFFWDSYVYQTPLLETTFYLPAALFLALWSVFWLMLYTRRLRRGLNPLVHSLAQELAASRWQGSLIPELDHACREFHSSLAALQDLQRQVERLTDQSRSPTGLSSSR